MNKYIINVIPKRKSTMSVELNGNRGVYTFEEAQRLLVKCENRCDELQLVFALSDATLYDTLAQANSMAKFIANQTLMTVKGLSIEGLAEGNRVIHGCDVRVSEADEDTLNKIIFKQILRDEDSPKLV